MCKALGSIVTATKNKTREAAGLHREAQPCGGTDRMPVSQYRAQGVWTELKVTAPETWGEGRAILRTLSISGYEDLPHTNPLRTTLCSKYLQKQGHL